MRVRPRRERTITRTLTAAVERRKDKTCVNVRTNDRRVDAQETDGYSRGTLFSILRLMPQDEETVW